MTYYNFKFYNEDINHYNVSDLYIIPSEGGRPFLKYYFILVCTECCVSS